MFESRVGKVRIRAQVTKYFFKDERTKCSVTGTSYPDLLKIGSSAQSEMFLPDILIIISLLFGQGKNENIRIKLIIIMT